MKDPRYKAIKSLIENKSLSGLKEIFDIIPISTVRIDSKTNYNTLRRRINNSNLLTVKDIVSMATLIEVDPLEIFRLSLNDIPKIQKNIRKK